MRERGGREKERERERERRDEEQEFKHGELVYTHVQPTSFSLS